MKECLLGFSAEEIKNIISELGEKSFRAKQIHKALYNGLEFCEMTDLPVVFRQKLAKLYVAQSVKIIKSLKSIDGTEKFLLQLEDCNVIECVLMKYKYGYTVCISSQVGCRMKCAFCASGLNGLVRNLTAAERLGEVVAVNKHLGGGLGGDRKVTNIVMMGSGEPLDNYDETIKFLHMVSAADGINISPRNISLSTSGLVPAMKKLSDEGIDINLTVSLHEAFDEERKKIMPIAKKYSISQIISACDEYFNKTGRRYIFEYVLIKGQNDDLKHAERLIKILKGKPCHINLIRLNEVKENDLKCGTEKDAYRFLGILLKGGLSCTLRRKIGEDIEGACGQLRQSYLKKENINEN